MQRAACGLARRLGGHQHQHAHQFHSTATACMPRIPRDALPTRREPSGDDLLDVTNPATGKLIAQVREPHMSKPRCAQRRPRWCTSAGGGCWVRVFWLVGQGYARCSGMCALKLCPLPASHLLRQRGHRSSIDCSMPGCSLTRLVSKQGGHRAGTRTAHAARMLCIWQYQQRRLVRRSFAPSWVF